MMECNLAKQIKMEINIDPLEFFDKENCKE